VKNSNIVVCDPTQRRDEVPWCQSSIISETTLPDYQRAEPISDVMLVNLSLYRSRQRAVAGMRTSIITP
jgi:hypothetical protein